MAVFRYKPVGGSMSGTIEAPDRASAIRELMREGISPSDLRVAESSSARSDNLASGRRGGGFAMSRADFAAFVRELATALTAGLPLVTSLRTMQRGGRSGSQWRMLEHLVNRVEHGKSLAEAAREWGKPFDDLTINLIVAGEVSGKLDEVLRQAAGLLDGDLKLRRAVVSATLYPAILAGLISIAVTVMVTVIVPKILGPMQGDLDQLPWPTQVVQGVADFVASWWWGILAFVGVLVVLVRAALRDPVWRLGIDRGVLRIPLFGRLFRDLAVARFTRTLGTLTGAGIPALQALRITKGTLANMAMERVIEDVCEQVSAGKTIADPMERSGYFPPMLVQIVNLGERTGKLDEVLAQAAEAFEERTQNSMKLLLTALPPMLVVILACVVGFVVIAIMLPLIDLQEAML